MELTEVKHFIDSLEVVDMDIINEIIIDLHQGSMRSFAEEYGLNHSKLVNFLKTRCSRYSKPAMDAVKTFLHSKLSDPNAREYLEDVCRFGIGKASLPNDNSPTYTSFSVDMTFPEADAIIFIDVNRRRKSLDLTFLGKIPIHTFIIHGENVKYKSSSECTHVLVPSRERDAVDCAMIAMITLYHQKVGKPYYVIASSTKAQSIVQFIPGGTAITDKHNLELKIIDDFDYPYFTWEAAILKGQIERGRKRYSDYPSYVKYCMLSKDLSLPEGIDKRNAATTLAMKFEGPENKEIIEFYIPDIEILRSKLVNFPIKVETLLESLPELSPEGQDLFSVKDYYNLIRYHPLQVHLNYRIFETQIIPRKYSHPNISVLKRQIRKKLLTCEYHDEIAIKYDLNKTTFSRWLISGEQPHKMDSLFIYVSVLFLNQ